MQGGSTGIGYGLKYQARCIADVKADTDHTSFITGTLSLKEENEVHLIRLSSGGTELVCEGLFSHPNEIWDLASCPFDQRIFSTVFSSGETFGAAIWQIPELYGQLNSPQLERIGALDGHDSKIKCTLWWPSGRHDKLVSIDEQNLFLWSLDSSRKTAQVQSQESAGMLHYLSGGAWDPHDINVVASICESSVQFWDLRTMKLEMTSSNIIDLCSDDELGEVDAKAVVKVEPNLDWATLQQNKYLTIDVGQHQNFDPYYGKQDSWENRSSNALSTDQSGTTIVDREQSPMDNTDLSSTPPICSAPLCRQFWKAGSYDDGLASSKSTYQNGKSYLHIHPKFLHSNATSHKWVFGAIAELLDNAVDEIQNGATSVIVDKISNPRDGGPALLIQDNGGGMDPEAMRRCLSFGFSDKKSKSAIGQYGNGFKTSSMRLGGDVIVFSRHLENRKLTQSIGLLSYTFLTQTGHDRIVVPMVDYEFNTSTNTLDPLHHYGKQHFMSNLSMLLKWSPFSSEAELLKQFDDIGYRGTKIIISNLWQSDDGAMELDFESDTEDIRIHGDGKLSGTRSRMATTEQHLANQLHCSLRAYLSILYLRVPESFRIILRGRVVAFHNIAGDLKFPEFILYKPQSGGIVEGTVITTIGFLKEAPLVNIHGFNVYHKNRLILPFWRAVSSNCSRGRGVVGVLEANFIEPTHNKQDFEKTSVFQKLENRLKEMTFEYWDYHCVLIGYQPQRKHHAPIPSQGSSDFGPHHGKRQPVVLNKSSSDLRSTKSPLASGAHQNSAAVFSDFSVQRSGQSISNFQRNSQQGAQLKRKEHGHLEEPENVKRKGGLGGNAIDTGSAQEIQPAAPANQLEDQEALTLLEENKKLHAQCLEYEKKEEELSFKATQLRSALEDVQREFARLLAESQLLDKIKAEKNVNA